MRPSDVQTDSILPDHRPLASSSSASSLQHPSPNVSSLSSHFPCGSSCSVPRHHPPPPRRSPIRVPPSQADVLQPARRDTVSSRVPVQASSSAGCGRAKTKGKKYHFWNRRAARARATLRCWCRHCLSTASSRRGPCFSSSLVRKMIMSFG